MSNRLAGESSPYLRQHQDNPVDWYPWGPEAFDKAQAEDKPIFLSVGYSSCHWCHVMAHECFEDDEVAALLNGDFISVKVDREERPDVDEAYMTAVQLMSQRGGWPMTVFASSTGEPFFAATYVPKSDRGEHPGLISLLGTIKLAWKTQRSELLKFGTDVAYSVRESLERAAPATSAKLDSGLLDAAVQAAIGDFDQENGGFGGAPKFPPHTAIAFLMGYASRESGPVELREAALGMALSTLERMAVGGIHDIVGGGFHRYSTDAKWVLPHFEKMLYDNAAMLSNYALGASAMFEVEPSLAELFDRTAESIVRFLNDDLRSPGGLLYAALDADSEGEEGKFYTWTVPQLEAALGARAGAFCAAFGCDPAGNFDDEATGRRNGANVLLGDAAAIDAFDAELQILAAERSRRSHPGLDEKAIVGWNGLAIGACAEVGSLELAQSAASSILAMEKEHGRLPHSIAFDVPSGDAFLDDYAYLIDGLLKLGLCAQIYSANRDALAAAGAPEIVIEEPARWFGEARRLHGEMVNLFYDDAAGGFFGTSGRHETLFGRSKPVFDQPSPSGNAVAIRCLVHFGDLARARVSLAGMVGWMERAPTACEALLTTAKLFMDSESQYAADRPEVVPEVPQPAVRPVGRPPVTVALAAREIRSGADGWADGTVLLSIPDGYHVNSNAPPARWLTPTVVTIQPVESETRYPTAGDEWTADLRIPFRVRLPQGQSGADFEVVVSFQVCTQSECLAPQEIHLSGVVI